MQELQEQVWKYNGAHREVHKIGTWRRGSCSHIQGWAVTEVQQAQESWGRPGLQCLDGVGDG